MGLALSNRYFLETYLASFPATNPDLQTMLSVLFYLISLYVLLLMISVFLPSCSPLSCWLFSLSFLIRLLSYLLLKFCCSPEFYSLLSSFLSLRGLINPVAQRVLFIYGVLLSSRPRTTSLNPLPCSKHIKLFTLPLCPQTQHVLDGNEHPFSASSLPMSSGKACQFYTLVIHQSPCRIIPNAKELVQVLPILSLDYYKVSYHASLPPCPLSLLHSLYSLSQVHKAYKI